MSGHLLYDINVTRTWKIKEYPPPQKKNKAGMSDTLYFYQDVTHCKSGARPAGFNRPWLVVHAEGNERLRGYKTHCNKVLEQIKMSFEPAGICHGSPMTSDPCSEMDHGQ